MQAKLIAIHKRSRYCSLFNSLRATWINVAHILSVDLHYGLFSDEPFSRITFITGKTILVDEDPLRIAREINNVTTV